MAMWRKLADTVHTAGLGVWLGVVLMSGAAAAVIFPTVKALNPSLPAFSAYTGDHWMIAAGRVADRTFAVSDAAQFVCALLAGAGLVLGQPIGDASWRTPRSALRITFFSGAITALAYQLFVLAPRMNANLQGHWTAAAGGDNAAAQALREAFTADHPTASTTLGVIAALVAICLGLAAWPKAAGGSSVTGTPVISRESARPEEPALARGGR